MATELVGRFRCEICDVDFDSMEGLTEHNVQQPPGTMPDAVPTDVESHGGAR
jgi:rubredoxin